MRSERGTAEQTAPARGREQSGVGERDAGMTNYSSRHSVGDRLPRWICISPEPGRMGTSGGNGYTRHTDILYSATSVFFLVFVFFFPGANCNVTGNSEGKLVHCAREERH